MKRKLFRFTAFLLAAVLLSPVFAGGSQEGESTSEEQVTLNFIEVLTSPSRTELINELIAEYEAENPNITINLISPPYEQADNKATLMLNNEQPLDIIEVRDYTVKQFVNNDKLESLEPYLAEWEGTDTLLPVTLRAARTVDDTAYLLPQFLFIKALFVRTDVLDELGVEEYPETIDELIDTSIAITDPANNQYGFGFRGKGAEFKFSDYITISNVENVRDGNIYLTEDGEFTFATDIAREYLERYVELYEEAVPSDGINWGFNEQINGFVSGTTPFLIQDPDTVGIVMGQLDQDKWTVIPLPVGESGQAYLDYGFGGLGIPSYSEHKEEAWDFIKFMISAETNARFAQGYGALPVHGVTYEENDYFSSGVYTAWQNMMDNNPNYEFKSYPLDSPKWPGWDQVHTQTMQSLLLGDMTIDEVISEWEAYWSE